MYPDVPTFRTRLRLGRGIRPGVSEFGSDLDEFLESMLRGTADEDELFATAALILEARRSRRNRLAMPDAQGTPVGSCSGEQRAGQRPSGGDSRPGAVVTSHYRVASILRTAHARRGHFLLATRFCLEPSHAVPRAGTAICVVFPAPRLTWGGPGGAERSSSAIRATV